MTFFVASKQTLTPPTYFQGSRPQHSQDLHPWVGQQEGHLPFKNFNFDMPAVKSELDQVPNIFIYYRVDSCHWHHLHHHLSLLKYSRECRDVLAPSYLGFPEIPATE